MTRILVNRAKVFQIAWPIILSNLSTPLLGLVDTAVIGNLGEPHLIGAIAVGAMIFSFLYWGFGFLRMGTTALVAQAVGAGKEREAAVTFYRAGFMGAAIGLLLLGLHGVLGALAFSLIDGSVAVESAGQDYFDIRILGAPFSLAFLAVTGVLLGLQNTRAVLLVNLILNGTNIALDIWFVMGLGWGVEGVASATVLAEITAISCGLYIVVKALHNRGTELNVSINQLLETSALKRMFTVNRDIMVRTLCLIFAFAWFTNEGATAGDVTLAANAILMQFVSFAAFFLDGFALAAESITGNAAGADNQRLLTMGVRYTIEWGALTAILLSIAFWASGDLIVNLLTTSQPVRDAASVYFIWVIFAPIVSVWCYLLDGIFIGATNTRHMRNAMIVSLGGFLLAWYLLQSFGNHGLWLALHCYFVLRALSLAVSLPALIRGVGETVAPESR